MAIVFKSLGKYTDSIRLFEPEVQAREQSGDAGRRDTAEALKYLGEVYLRVGRYAEAEAAFARARSLIEAAVGPDDELITEIMIWQADLFRQTQRYVDAELTYERVRGDWARARGPSDPWTLSAVKAIVRLKNDRGLNAEAKDLIQVVVEQEGRSTQTDSQAAAYTLYLRAEILRDTNEPDEAQELYRQALELYARTLPPKHPTLGIILASRGRLFARCGRTQDAVEAFRTALDFFAEAGVQEEQIDVKKTREALAALVSA